jgi:aconitate hydratase
MSIDSSGARDVLDVGGESYEVFRVDAVAPPGLPYSHRVLLENLLRREDGVAVTAAHVRALARWDPAGPAVEIPFVPARLLMQDYSGLPCLVELAAMREALAALGGNPTRVDPVVPAQLVIDHSVMADVSGTRDAFARNVAIDHDRNRERYEFVRWCGNAFRSLTIVPPNTGIIHQVNIERLATVVTVRDGQLFPDSVLGTDSHTTMVNGLGVLGWGIGGIEALATMLGEQVWMLVPPVVGFELTGALAEGVTSTDLVLAITERLRRHGVVGKIVEFHGEGVAGLTLGDRATLSNMSPEYGSTCAIFPIDEGTLRYLRVTGRTEHQAAIVEAYAKTQGLWHDPQRPRVYSETISLDLSAVVPAIAGPRRPQDRVPLTSAKEAFRQEVRGRPARATAPVRIVRAGSPAFELEHGAVLIAAITSCTNTSNPSVMVAAGLLARKAVEKGLTCKPWVKSTLAPGSRAVMECYERTGLGHDLDQLGFNLVAFGCTTCIGNSGPLAEDITAAVRASDMAGAAVLSGNRNFEGRISPDVELAYLASPPLVVAYALAGTVDIDLTSEPLGTGADGSPVYLHDLWPSSHEIEDAIRVGVTPETFARGYAGVLDGDVRWRSLAVPAGDAFPWDPRSTYVRRPPFFDHLSPEPPKVSDIEGARVLVKLGDSVTTDHISPAGGIDRMSEAGRYLSALGVDARDFNSYGARRTNHEVLVRGTFANPRLRNRLLPGVEGGLTVNLLSGERTTVFEAATAYREAGVPLIVLAGLEYGSGSSRDWAAKGPALLGVRAVIAGGFERIHRSNLVGMGVLPLQLPAGTSVESLGLTGTETFDIVGLSELNRGAVPRTVRVRTGLVDFDVSVRLDTRAEADYYRHGGVMAYVLRKLLRA